VQERDRVLDLARVGRMPTFVELPEPRRVIRRMGGDGDERLRGVAAASTNARSGAIPFPV
jgi:hypothetical protein